jgi:amidase
MSETPVYPDLLHISLNDIRTELDTKTFTTVDLTNACIVHIQEVGTALEAVVEINPDALDIAEQLDIECEAHVRRGQVHTLFLIQVI